MSRENFVPTVNQQMDSNERKIEIIVTNNGFLVKTKSGWFIFKTTEDLKEFVGDYTLKIQKTMRKPEEGK